MSKGDSSMLDTNDGLQMIDQGDCMSLLEEQKSYVRLTEDSMEAWLYLVPLEEAEEVGGTSSGKKEYTKEDVYQLLTEAEVKKGFIESNIAAMIKKHIYFREVKVAEGKSMIPGKDGYYEYLVNTVDYSKNPKINEDGTVDYQSMSLLQNVRKGDVLARYFKSVPGTAGFDVRGKLTEPPAVKDLPAMYGKGFSKNPDADEYRADLDGKIAFNNGKMEIRNVHEISGDVDALVGRVEFFGDVVINGNVGPGIIIRAGKTVTISGTVESVDIEAGGDIILKRGVQGNEKARIVSKGNVFADFIEYANVTAAGDVSANIILNSNIHAAGKVLLTGKKGTLLGGNVHGFQGIEATNLGNDMEVKTIVHVGCEPAVYNQRHALIKKEADLKERFKGMREEFSTVLKQRKLTGATPMSDLKIAQMTKLKEEMEAEEKELQRMMQENLETLEKGKNSYVHIDGNIYRGVVIGINNNQIAIDHNTCFMDYRMISGVITGNVIVRN